MKYINIFILLLGLVSCKKDPIETIEAEKLKNGFLVLNEGLFQLNNASLSWIDLSNNSVVEDYFLKTNGRNLGDTGNDILRYGGKIYIIVNVSSIIEVLDANTGKSIRQIPLQYNGISSQPRRMIAKDNQILITSFDGYVNYLDTTALVVHKRVKVGSNPEQIVFYGDRYFVANSGGLNFEKQDSTISVVDYVSGQEQKIKVGLNPVGMQTDKYGNVYVLCNGNYDDVPSQLVKINPITLEQKIILGNDITGIYAMDGELLLRRSIPNSSKSKISLFNSYSETIQVEDYIDLSGITIVNNIQYEPKFQRLFVMEAKQYVYTGYVHIFDLNGNKLSSHHVGLNPNSIVFYE